MITRLMKLVARWRKPEEPEGIIGDKLLTRAQAERFLDSITLDNWRVRHGEVLPAIKVNGVWLHSEEQLVDWLDGNDTIVVHDDEYDSRNLL